MTSNILDNDIIKKISIIIPAKNENENLEILLPELKNKFKNTEILVIDDGSQDDTTNVCKRNNIDFISHPYSKGNGAAIKTGARQASGKIFVFMDGDGQHSPEDISRLLKELDKGYDMVVGARDSKSQASLGRKIANKVYSKLASWVSGHKIMDLTSGFRAVRADKFKEFLFLLPNGFSYPTTSTMAFFRSGYSVTYIPIQAGKRKGKSHINIWRDGIRFFLIIFKIGTLYSPIKIFFPVSLGYFFTGLGYYLYTYFTSGRFTNMGVLLFSLSVFVFLIGLISEQITSLMYVRK